MKLTAQLLCVASAAALNSSPYSLSRFSRREDLASIQSSLSILNEGRSGRSLVAEHPNECLTASTAFWGALLTEPTCYQPSFNASFSLLMNSDWTSHASREELQTKLGDVCPTDCLHKGVQALEAYSQRTGVGCSSVRNVLTVLNVMCMADGSEYCYPTYIALQQSDDVFDKMHDDTKLDEMCGNTCVQQMAWALVSSVNVTAEPPADALVDRVRVIAGTALSKLASFLCFKDAGQYCIITLRDELQHNDEEDDGHGPSANSTDVDLVNDNAVVCSTCGRAFMTLAIDLATMVESEFHAHASSSIISEPVKSVRRLEDGVGVVSHEGGDDSTATSGDIANGGGRNFSTTDNLRNVLYYGCGEANGHRCLDWWSKDTLAADPALAATLDSLQSACVPYIRSVSTGSDTTCPSACTAAINNATSRIGCCVHAALALNEALGVLPPVADAAHVLNSQCGVHLEPCIGRIVKYVAIKLSNLKYEWATSEAVREALKRAHRGDLAVSAGIDASVFTVADIRDSRDGGIVIITEILAASDPQTSQVTSQLQTQASTSTLVGPAVGALVASHADAAFVDQSHPTVSSADVTSSYPSPSGATASTVQALVAASVLGLTVKLAMTAA